MQNSQIQLFRPPVSVRRTCAIRVMERTLRFSLCCFFVCHIACPVWVTYHSRHGLLEISQWKDRAFVLAHALLLMESDGSNTCFRFKP